MQIGTHESCDGRMQVTTILEEFETGWFVAISWAVDGSAVEIEPTLGPFKHADNALKAGSRKAGQLIEEHEALAEELSRL